MKKILFTKCWLVVCCILLSSNIYSIHIEDGLCYTLHEEGRTATFEGVVGSIKSEITNVIIPSTIPIKVIPNGTVDYKVTEIATYAFFECNKLTSVIISEGITKIGDRAFIDCSALNNITIPPSVTFIGYDAFAGTEWYEKILPDGLVYINSMVYSYKGEMPENTALSIKEGTEIIGSSAFDGYENLTSISLPSSLKKIDTSAFNDCKNLTSIFLPNNLKIIEASAFSNCKNLSEITLPENLEFIGAGAFNRSGLKTLTIPGSVKYMGPTYHPQTIFFEGITPPSTASQNDMFPYHVNRTFFVPYESFAAYCDTKLIPLGTDSYNAMSVKALEDSEDIYAVITKIGDSDGWGELAGEVTVNGKEKLTGIKQGEKIEINVKADTNIMVIDSIQINDEKPYKFIDRTSFTHTIESAAARPYTIKVNFKDKKTVSISDQTIDTIQVYASNGTVKIENINETAPVTILNLAGQTLYQGTTDSYAPVLLPSGIYLVKVGTQTHKIVMK